MNNTTFFGHPAALKTLFLTEMWERMSYYGMRALLVLFMTAAISEGGLSISVAQAAAIYGLYTGAVYVAGLPGGWLADRVLGSQRAVWIGGWVILAGHVVLALPTHVTFFAGLLLVVAGTGLLKPSITSLVGELYHLEEGLRTQKLEQNAHPSSSAVSPTTQTTQTTATRSPHGELEEPSDEQERLDNEQQRRGIEQQRRDSGYTLYYMAINIGAFLGYLVTGALAENAGWHYGFGAAAVGMAAGLWQFKRSRARLGSAGLAPAQPLTKAGLKRTKLLGWVLLFSALGALIAGGLGWLSLDAVRLAQGSSVAMSLLFVCVFVWLTFGSGLSANQKKRMGAIGLICLASACFWAGFEQAGSSLNLFARDYTDRLIGGFEVPTTWFLSLNPLFIFILSPFLAAFWIWLGKRLIKPSYVLRTGLGLLIMGSGFLVMFFAAKVAASGLPASAAFLVTTYFLHTLGELLLSPVALSAVSKLAPKQLSNQLMGLFVLTYGIGNLLAGLFAGQFDPDQLGQLPGLFMQVFLFSLAAGVLVLALDLVTSKWERA